MKHLLFEEDVQLRFLFINLQEASSDVDVQRYLVNMMYDELGQS